MSKVQEHYDGIAVIYDNRYDRARGRDYHSHISRQVLATLPKGGFILDVGCGTGLFLQRYITNGGGGIGLDISPGMITEARRRLPGSEFTVGTAENLPFRDGTFDAVASLLAFSYLKNPDQMLAEARRVLRPGGTLAICTLGRNVLTSMVPTIYRLGETLRVRKIGMGDFGERYYNEKEMRALFSDAGFVDVRVNRCSFAHLTLSDPIFKLAKRVEPIIEKKLPYLAYNVCVSGTKPE
jgi:ubiquinone/menaquinone biosynthesis C-methylase UbiE